MLDSRFDRSMEEKWQKKWMSDKTHDFHEKDFIKPVYSIDTPPPFTSGELHMGHVLSYSFIDFTARFKRMNGFNVFYPQGWDSQGFPTEVKVEKKYGRLPPLEFRQKCIEWTNEMIEKMRNQMISVGFAPDWRYQYITMTPDYHKKVQLSLTKMYKDTLVYRGKYPVFFCPRCSSAVAKSELEDEPKNGNLNYIYFTCEGKNIPIATTRPELMGACVAVLFNPNDERYKFLEGKTITTALGKDVPAIADSDVDKEFGTGLLMVCTFGDKMDVIWQNRYKLPIIEVINSHGKMQNSGPIDGLKVEEARKKILEILGDKVFKKESTNQVVKVHDRCKTPIELISSFQWFADIRTTSKHIKNFANKIKWHPDFGISYLVDWVENAEWDWVISRQRVFGTPLPFYYCECGKTATADDSDLPFYPEKAKQKLCDCGRPMHAETSTCDCWVDSSITPLIIAGWPDDEAQFSRLYPASLRPQGVEIVRTWAFYTIHRSGLLTSQAPFKEILLNGNVLAPDGKKMSKSLGNVISPSELLRDYPADAIRQWAALSGAMAKDRPFSYEDIKYAKSFLTKIWNAARFYETLKNQNPNESFDVQNPSLNVLDKWVLGRLNQTIVEVSSHFEAFEFQSAMSKLQKFFWQEFCDYYLEFIKHRVYVSEKPIPSRSGALYSLHHVLFNSIKLLAPITPHICEEIYHNLFGKTQSIHQSHYPSKLPLPSFESEVALGSQFCELVSLIRQYKSKNKLAQNAEIENALVFFPIPLGEELEAELKSICKIKNVQVSNGSINFVVN